MNKQLMIFGLMGLFSFYTFASGVGNGGVSVVCRDNAQRITEAQLLDIYEGEVRYNKKYDNVLDSDTKVELAQLKLVKYPAFLAAFQEELARVRAVLMFIPVGNELTPTNDAFPAIIKQGCEFEQLANYTNDGDLLVSQEIYNELSNVDIAGLLVHETVYSLFRKEGAQDSRQARKLTAELLAKNADLAVINQIIEKEFQRHSAPGPCGLKGSIEERIKSCRTAKGNFALVARTLEGFEVYKDLTSGLIWGDRLPSIMNHYNAVKACKSDLKEVASITGVTWRLPSIDEYKETEKNGIRQALPHMNHWFWSSSVSRDDSNYAWLFGGNFGNTGDYDRNYDFWVRCVAGPI